MFLLLHWVCTHTLDKTGYIAAAAASCCVDAIPLLAAAQIMGRNAVTTPAARTLGSLDQRTLPQRLKATKLCLLLSHTKQATAAVVRCCPPYVTRHLTCGDLCRIAAAF